MRTAPAITERVALSCAQDMRMVPRAWVVSPSTKMSVEPSELGASEWPVGRACCASPSTGPGLNAVDHDVHRELADVWLAVDRDPDTNVAVIQGAGRAFSAGGSFELIDAMMSDYAVRARVMREARDLVYNVINCSKPIVSAIHGPAVGAGLVAGCSPTSRSWPDGPDHRRPHPLGVAAGDHAAICWPLLCGMAKAKYYLLTCDAADRRGGRAHRAWCRCASTTTRCRTGRWTSPSAGAGAQAAIRWTKQTLNHWYRAQSAILDASLAYEFRLDARRARRQGGRQRLRRLARRHGRRCRPAQEVVDEIVAAGGEAVANGADVSTSSRPKAADPAGDRHLRRPRRPRQQRRDPARPDAVLDDRGRVGRGHQGAPQGHVRARRTTPPATGATGPRPARPTMPG